MKKEMLNKFGGTYYLLGKDRNGKRVYLQDFKWDCDWYWAGGYLNTFNKKFDDIDSHYHFDGVVNESKLNAYDAIKNHLPKMVLNEKELWLFCDLMISFYALKEAAEVIGRGGSHLITHDKIGKYPDLAKELNEIIEKKIKPSIESLLTDDSVDVSNKNRLECKR